MSLSPPISSNSRPPRTCWRTLDSPRNSPACWARRSKYGLKKLPRKVNEKLGSVIEGALLKVARSATATLQENASGQPANRLHTLGAAVSGGVGGFFGPLAMLVEVPVTTGIIFRSIADIARSEGESIRDMDTLMACIEVFALGGKSASDDASESGYYAVRTALAQQVKAAADFLGKDAGSKKAAPMLLALVRKVAERLGVQYSGKARGADRAHRRRPRRRGDQHGVHEPFQAMARASLRRPPPGTPLRQGCGSRRLRPAAPARLSMPAHAVSLAPGAAAATRQLFSAVSLAAEPGWSRAPRRLRAPGRGCTTDGKRNGWCRRSGCRNSSGDSRCRSCWCRR